MPKRTSSLLALLIGLLLPVLCLAADATRQAIYAQGVSASHQAWVLQAFAATDPELHYTLAWQREVGSPDWRQQPGIPFPIAQATQFGPDLVVLLNDGTWLRLGDSTGQPLPDQARILSLAGDATTLFALGQPGAATTRPSATQPATTLAATTPAATTSAAAPSQPAVVRLYELTRTGWQSRGPVPQELLAGPHALGVVAGQPRLATVDNATLSFWQLSPEGTWRLLGQHPTRPGLQPRQILEDSGRSFILLSSDSGPGQLQTFAGGFLPNLDLPCESPLRDMCLVGGMLRLVYADGQSLKERSIDPRTLQIAGPDVPLELVEAWDYHPVWNRLQWLNMALVLLVMAHTWRNRSRYRKVKIDFSRYQLCPFGRRAFAAIIDLAPILAMALYVRLSVPQVSFPSDLFSNRQAFMLMFVSVLAYLAFTSLMEVLFGRSLGKMIAHMRVITVDGTPPTAGMLFTRNILRIIDLTMFYTPVLVLYLPMRQRIGDLAAGTVVVIDKEPVDA